MQSLKHNTKEIIHYYEGDQSKLYSGVFNHAGDIKSKESKDKIAQIWKVTAFLSVVTVVEVLFGLFGHNKMNHALLLTIFIVLTLVKAAYIVKIFMHLGDEKKQFVYLELFPLLFLIWLIIALLYEGNYYMFMNYTLGETIKDSIMNK